MSVAEKSPGAFVTLDQQAKLSVLRMVGTSSRIVRLAYYLIAGLLIATVAILFIPWQQTLRGRGRVVAFNPVDRQFNIESSIVGRVVAIHVVEGSKVKEGDVLFELQDNDPNFRQNMMTQVDSIKAKQRAYEEKVKSYQEKVQFIRDSMRYGLEAADTYVSVALQMVDAEQQNLAAAQASLAYYKADLERTQSLAQSGIDSTQKLQAAQQNYAEYLAKVKSTEAKIKAAQDKVEGEKANRQSKQRDFEGYIRAAQGDLAAAQAEVAGVQKELRDLEIKLSQFENQRLVKAQRSGTILELSVNRDTELVYPGDKLAVLVPDTENADLAVELMMDGNDVPLIQPGREVRLLFEGWPAIQFSGWPDLAYGAFSGKVQVVDPTDDGKGKFRILVVPYGESDEAPQGGNRAWPKLNIRQGVRADGLVLLDTVPAYWEIWRQLNAFPPAYVESGDKSAEKDKKKEKKPKIKLPK